MPLKVTSAVLAQLRAEAAQAHPRECCGILLGDKSKVSKAWPARNIHPSPETHFEIDPEALIDAHREARAGRLAIAGYYHSHPSGAPVPSETDTAMAAGDGMIWAIIAGEDVRFWLSLPNGFEPLIIN